MAQSKPKVAIETAPGRRELRRARRESRGYYWGVGLFSMVVNLLMLTGPLYMLNVYDRVLGSRSEETLVALSLLVLFLFAIMGVLDYVRGRIMGRVGAAFQTRMDRRVFTAAMRLGGRSKTNTEAALGLQDLEAVQRLLASPVLMALFDLPWTPIFLVGIFVFHPMLGVLALAGGAVLILIAVINQITSKRPMKTATEKTQIANRFSTQIRHDADLVQALGMRDAAFTRWQKARDASLAASLQANDVSGIFAAFTRSFRLFLQSAMLGLGAYLVLQNEMTAGAMIAGSILLGRALAPLELLVTQWSVVQRAREGWDRLAKLLSAVPEEDARTELPRPKAHLQVEQLTVIAPNAEKAALRAVSFHVTPGQAIGIIGPSGAGKSTLAKAITGIWPANMGTVRLDRAALDHYDPDVLGGYIGYLPQQVTLFDGTIKENIARLAPEADDAKVVSAAKNAAAHEMILALPEGYDTRVSPEGGRLSGGQIQRIGLARALYNDPVVVILDEPNSNLDHHGSLALNAAIRRLKSNGACVLIMAHRPSAIQECDLLLMLDQGTRRAFGPRDQVLKEVTQNHQTIQNPKDPGALS